MPLLESDLKALLGKHVRELCTLHFDSDKESHCAHFVSHFLGYRFGATCADLVRGTGTPATIRVQDMFARCPRVGKWSDAAARPMEGLVFITHPGNVNVATKVMSAVPKAHVGIFTGGGQTVYHYSNHLHQFATQSSEEFSHHYPEPHNAMYWGALI